MTLTHAKTCLNLLLVMVTLGVLTACAPTAERRSTGEFADDAALTARVKTALAREEGLKGAANINVNSYRGEVQLTGIVENDEMIRRAVSTARRVEGVRTVQNDLRVGARGGTK